MSPATGALLPTPGGEGVCGKFDGVDTGASCVVEDAAGTAAAGFWSAGTEGAEAAGASESAGDAVSGTGISRGVGSAVREGAGVAAE